MKNQSNRCIAFAPDCSVKLVFGSCDKVDKSTTAAIDTTS